MPDSTGGTLRIVPGRDYRLGALFPLTAGFCEEAIFRGYLQKQFHALTGSAAIAVLAQAILFGIAHGYQGLKNVIVITVLGLLYGLLALARGILRPGMIAHVWSDVYGGLPIRFF